MPGRLIVAPVDVFADTAARWIADRIRHAVHVRGTATLALAGGGTPAPVYQKLALQDVPWPNVHVFFGDERRVPPDHPSSNFRMVRETLLDGIGPEARVHRMQGEAADGDAAAVAYEAELPEVLDLVVLGMGEDAHTASLFPESAALSESARRVLAVPGPPEGHARLTLTPPALTSARERVVLVAGAAKAEVLARVFESEPDPGRMPVQLALAGTWIVDERAAAMLRPAR